MSITRRGFFGLCAAAGLATLAATTRLGDVAKNLLPQWLILYGDGMHDDTEALQALFNGEQVVTPDGEFIGKRNGVIELRGGAYQIFEPLTLSGEVCIENVHIMGNGNIPYLLKIKSQEAIWPINVHMSENIFQL